MKKEIFCSAEITIKIICGRWKALIWKELFSGSKRFGVLRKSLNGITEKMLIQQLREMRRDGLILRKDHNEVPPKVEYSLTPLGKSLRPVIQAMHKWGLYAHKFL